MISALKDQKIRRRGGMGSSGGSGRKIHFKGKGSLLSTLFFITIGLLIMASVFFSMSHSRDTGKLELPEITSTEEELLGKGSLVQTLEGGEISPLLIHSAAPTQGPNHFCDQETLVISNHPGAKGRVFIPPVHILKAGDTISEISQKYNVSMYELIKFNKIKDPTRLRINNSIFIPQGVTGVINTSHTAWDHKEGTLPESLEISADKNSGTAPLKVSFRLNTKIPIGSPIYIWDLGTEKFAFTPETVFTYEKPGTYKVFLMVSDQENNEVISNKLTITVKAVYKKVTAPVKKPESNKLYITLEDINGVLDLGNYFKSEEQTFFLPGATSIIQNRELLTQIEPDKFLAVDKGYSQVTIKSGEKRFDANLFVSPFPTKYAYTPDYDWYKTQFKTGFNGNCGPACVAMAIHWAKAEPVSVADIRKEIGYPIKNGAISFYHMLDPFKRHKAKAFFTTVNHAEDMRKIIDRGNIAIILYHTGKISKTSGNTAKSYIGRYYTDTTGHYTIINGYTTDKKYFNVYDPIPGDWVENDIRYEDGESMLGRNRYYPTEEVMDSLKSANVLEISRG